LMVWSVDCGGSCVLELIGGERVRGRLKNPACAEESQQGQHIMALLATTLKKNCKMNE